VRLAARVVDELVGGNPANLGECDCPPCGCEFRHPDGTYRQCEHDLACPHHGADDADSERVSARLRAFADDVPALGYAFGRGLEAVFDLAGLTASERQVMTYHLEGLSSRSIGMITNRQPATVRVLAGRAEFKLRALGESQAVAA
jgi:DNA-binding CsgD family transcriptional regulator